MTEWMVSPKEAGSKLVNFIRDKLQGGHTARSIKRALEDNQCQVNGAVERFASRELKVGDKVKFDLREQKATHPWVSLYADEGLIVLNKPSGVVVDSPQTLELLTQQFGPVILVHRLDRDTSGALLVARTTEIAALLQAQFKRHEVEKSYYAIVDGIPIESQGEVHNRLGKLHSYEGQSIWGPVTHGGGLTAQTAWKVVSKGDRTALMLCHPKTGRTHQLRVHLKGLGHPILGDYQYARRFASSYRPQRCLLHAAEIAFMHPQRGDRQRVRAPLPQDFKQALYDLKLANKRVLNRLAEFMEL